MGLGDLLGAIGGIVVDDDHLDRGLVRPRKVLDCLVHILECGTQVGLLVIRWDDYGNPRTRTLL